MMHQPYGHGNIVFSLPECVPPLVVKTSDRLDSFAHTEANLDALKKLGIPVPSVMGRLVDDRFSIIVLEWIEGEDLGYALAGMTHPQRIMLASQVVGIQRKVVELPEGTGFGWTPIGQPGPFANWLEIVTRDLGRLSPKFQERLSPILAQLESEITAVRPVPFLDDLTVKNVIIQEGRLQGIVDLDHICYGDPLFWLALAETTVMLDVGEEATDYSNELRRLWLIEARSCGRLGFYEALFAASFLDRELQSEQAVRMERFFELRLG